MKPAIRFVKPTILMLIRITKILTVIALFTGCQSNEPAFIVKGDKILTKDIKVNVEVLKQDSTIMATTFYNGKSYKIQNQGTLRYAIYVSYKDSLFYKWEFDNLHGEMKGKPINEIIVTKKGNAILALYRPLKESSSTTGTILLPWNIFAVEVPHIKMEKFTAFYGSK